MIEMENPVIGEIRFQDLERFSSKTDVWNHGFGIANVKAAVEKNHGEISFVQRENMFMVQMLFPLEN